MKKFTNVVLDLDNTLISAVDANEEKALGSVAISRLQSAFNWENLENEFKIFERPHLQKFLTWLFNHFNVSVWTAASQEYAYFIVERFILINLDRKIDYVLFSDHCNQSLQYCKSHKNLAMLHHAFPMGYNPDETIIIDDHEEVYHTQPTRCIRIKPFDVKNPDCFLDYELLKVLKQLRQVKRAV